MDWISVDDQMPPIYQDVLVWATNTDGDHTFAVSHFAPSVGWLIEVKEKGAVAVTHWARVDPPEHVADGFYAQEEVVK